MVSLLFDEFLGVLNGGADVCRGHIVFAANLLKRHSTRQTAEYARDRQPRAANHGLAVLDFRIKDNSFVHSVCQVQYLPCPLAACKRATFVYENAHRSDGFENRALVRFNHGDGLFASDREEGVQKVFDGFAALQIINEVLEWNARAQKDGRAAHNLRVGVNDTFEFFNFHALK